VAILVTGIAGGLAQRVAAFLLERGEDVVGVDYRNATIVVEGARPIVRYRAAYDKTAIEDVFRRHRFSAVLHLGRVGNLSERIEKRFDLNVVGSQKLMQLCVDQGVKTLVVLSTFHIYGAHARNHTPISEDDPLRAGTRFPEIADAIQLDNMASTWVYRHREVRTVVLRPTNIVGPHINNTMSQFLRLPRVPYLAGFNPMVQFIAEDDLRDAIVATLDGDAWGIFNVAGPTAIPWRTALELAGARGIPLPAQLVEVYLRAFSSFPAYLAQFYKYPCVITDAAFRRAFGWRPRIAIEETLRATVAATRRRGTHVARDDAGDEARDESPARAAGAGAPRADDARGGTDGSDGTDAPDGRDRDNPDGEPRAHAP
jgi:UDP-glucose 4-epimerase